MTRRQKKRCVRFTGAVVLILCLGMLMGTVYAENSERTKESLYITKEETTIQPVSKEEQTKEQDLNKKEPEQTKWKPEAWKNTEDTKNTENAEEIEKPENAQNEKNMGENLSDDWNLILVNQTHPMPEDYRVELKEIGSGHRIDVRIYEDYRAMIQAAKEAGIYLYVTSSYRDMDKQTQLHEKKIESYVMQGYSYAEAKERAAQVVAVPGTSEHHLGLALDFVSSEYKKLDERQETTKSFQWLKEHCAEYGFILRYPNGKTDITGIIYEPWHFRYVGKEAAAIIMETGITLEEYLGVVSGS